VIREGDLLWTPDPQRIERARLTHFMRWLDRERGRRFEDYASLWRWSVQDLEGFWSALWKYFGIRASVAPSRALGRRAMPGAEWFPGARLNYAENVLAHARPGHEALLYMREGESARSLFWDELTTRVHRVAAALRRLGIVKGDRVVGCLPNAPEAVVAMLATTSIGAIWSGCGPDFGPRGILDRFTQLAPKLLICVDGYQYGGKRFDRRAEMQGIIAALPTLQHVVLVPYLDQSDRRPLAAGTLLWDDFVATGADAAAAPVFEQVPADYPLWILFSSGTTGLPKPIVHGHAGITIEQMKNVQFHMDVQPGQRMFFFTTTGWMMWNFLVSAPLSDVIPVLYDGNPAWPGPDALWRMAEQTGISFFGASPTYQQLLAREGVEPGERFDLSRLESVTLAGSPVTPECMLWFHEHVGRDLWVQSGSGGTDVCSGFCGGVVLQPVYAGEIQAPQLGVALAAFDADGRSVIDEVGEMVITEPMPSMPVCFWNDPGDVRYRESYFEDFPGVWRHGDFFRINARGGCFVLGRSDATLNRHGVRIGTAEIYRGLAGLPDLEDSLVVNLDLAGGRFFMPLFVKLREGRQLDAGIEQSIRERLRTTYSPRHVPDRIIQVPSIPYTLTGKKLEVPVRRILSGVPAEKAANRSAMADPTALDFFIDYARTQRDYALQELSAR
jgi:acetoacetyl-CoA synthetase